jgi:hypothetical protein
LWVSSSKPILEPICTRVNNVESNDSFKNVTDSSTKELISILHQNENEAVIIMPCDGSVVDEADNVYRLKGPFELKCGDMVTFNYTTNRVTWHGDQCSGEPKLPIWPHGNGEIW